MPWLVTANLSCSGGFSWTSGGGAPPGDIAGNDVSITANSKDLIAINSTGIRIVTKFMIGTKFNGSGSGISRFDTIYLLVKVFCLLDDLLSGFCCTA
jgi:hypothetical protein